VCFVPRGTAHTYWIRGLDQSGIWLIMTSNIYSIDKGNHALWKADSRDLRAVFGKYDSDL